MATLFVCMKTRRDRSKRKSWEKEWEWEWEWGASIHERQRFHSRSPF